MERGLNIIDSDVFLRDLRYSRDKKIKATREFLELVKDRKISGATTIYNFLEILGVMSYNLSEEDIVSLFRNFPATYNIVIIFPIEERKLVCFKVEEVFLQIRKEMGILDALIASLIEKRREDVETFVTWNKKHFQGKLPARVLTPEEAITELQDLDKDDSR